MMKKKVLSGIIASVLSMSLFTGIIPATHLNLVYAENDYAVFNVTATEDMSIQTTTAVTYPLESTTTTTVTTTAVSEKQAVLDDLTKKENRLFGEFQRERAILSGKLDPATERLTLDEVKEIIDRCNSYAEICKELSDAQTYPDFIGGSGVTKVEYWFDDCGYQKLLLIIEEEDAIYVKCNDSGKITDWNLLYPAKKEIIYESYQDKMIGSFMVYNDISAASEEVTTGTQTTEPVQTTTTLTNVNPQSPEMYGFALETPEIILNVGESQKLNVLIDSNYYHADSLVYVSDSAKVASVSTDGTVSARSEGTAHIKVSAKVNPDKVELMPNESPVRSVTATITVVDNTLTPEQKAALKKLEQKENWLIGEFRRERAVIRGELAPDAARLTLDEVNAFIETSDSFESVMKKLQEAQTYPDYFGGSGVTLIEYWLDDCGTEKVIIILEQKDLVYIRLNPDGSQNEWDFLYPVKQNHEQSFNSAIVTRIYTLFNDIADGDVNADGTFSIADAVLLQKWLLASPDTSLVNWKAADFHKDNLINAIDFTLMKRQLLNTKA